VHFTLFWWIENAGADDVRFGGCLFSWQPGLASLVVAIFIGPFSPSFADIYSMPVNVIWRFQTG